MTSGSPSTSLRTEPAPMASSHMISASEPRGGRLLVEGCARLHVHDLRGPFGWLGSHEVRASDGAAIKLRVDVGERHGWAHVEYWRPGAAWASSGYDLGLFARDQHFGGLAWAFSCPVAGVRTPVLYLPAGASSFASRQAHGLAFTSQRQRAPARAADRAHRLAANLGVVELGTAPVRSKGIWGRPRGIIIGA